MDFWQLCHSLRAFVDRYATLIVLSLSASVCRIAFGWALSTGKDSIDLPFAYPTVHLLVVIAELVAWLALAALYHVRPAMVRDDSRVIVVSFACLALGTLGAYACSLPFVTSRGFLGILSCVLMGAGRASTIVLWAAELSMLSRKEFIFGICIVYVLDLACYWALDGMEPLVAAVLLALAILMALFAFAFWQLRLREACVLRRDCRGLKDVTFPIRTALWCCAFSIAYGLGSSYTGLGNSSMAMHVGYALPALMLMAFIALAPDHFDLRSIFATTLALMAIGLLMIAFLEGFPVLTQLFMSASLAGVYILMLAIVCSRAKRDGMSPVFDCACCLAASSFCIQAAKAVADVAVGHGMLSLVAGACIMVIIVGYLLVAREDTYLAYRPQSDLSAADRGEGMDEKKTTEGLHLDGIAGGGNDQTKELADKLCTGKSLTERERAVFELLLLGQSIQQIGNTLFIAPSTVRVHASHVYDKFGVHSRQEFNSLVMSAFMGEMGYESLDKAE